MVRRKDTGERRGAICRWQVDSQRERTGTRREKQGAEEKDA